ncbi:hypothetical protein BKA62DRAFT_694682 [Auriculariales sp. MPI-PUGE-AT-0066]|nr:hypothetical protein BKA62DRAFT_694682 [Auriculariales sp. MPI-PUGE-AT-0066]
MASLNKLAIRGIRSFDDKQISVIEFFSPVTVIVGANGSGKTTIIECLKYATTGEQPPNTRSGGAFIHDPVLANEKEVKAQVKLRFNAANGTRMLAVRNLQVSRKKTGGLTMKTLENILSLADAPEGNKRATISTKCAEIDEEIPHLLGVSKSVLENVIFCHQEDSYWPLSEPSALKKKFDDIFEATRYTKALDALKSLRKERVSELKVEKERLQSLANEKGHADKLRGKISDLTKNITSKEFEFEKLGEELQRAIKANVLFYEQSSKFKETYLKYETLTRDIARLTNQVNQLKADLTILNEPVHELQQRLLTQNDRHDNMRKEQGVLERQRADAQEQIDLNQSTLDDLIEEGGRLQAEAKAHEKHIHDRENLIRELSVKYSLTEFGPRREIDRSAVIDFGNALSNVQEIRNKDVQSLQRENKAKQKEFDTTWSQLVQEETALRAERTMLRDDQTKLASSITTAERRLDGMQMDISQLPTLEDELGTKRSHLERLRAATLAAAYGSQISNIGRRLRELEEQRDRLFEEQKALAGQSEARASLTVKRQELDKLQKELQTHLKSSKEKYRQHVGREPEAASMEREVERASSDKDHEVNEAQDALDLAVRNAGEIQTLLKSREGELADRAKQLNDLEKKLSQAMGEEKKPIHQVIREHQEVITDLTRESASSEAQLEVFKHIVQKSKDKKTCITCNRGIDEHERTVIESYMDRQLQRNAQGERDDTDLKQYEAEVLRLQRLLPFEQNKDRLKNTEIPELKTQIEHLKKKLTPATEERDRKSQELEELKRQQRELGSLKITATNVSRVRTAISNLEHEVQLAESQVADGAASRPSDVIEQELRAVSDEWKKCDADRSKLNTERDRNANEQSITVDRVHKLENEVKELKSRQNESETLEKTIEESRKQIAMNKDKVKDLDLKLQAVEGPKQLHKRTKEEHDHEFNERIEAATASVLEISKSIDSMTGLRRSGAARRLEKQADERAHAQRELKEAQESLNVVTEKLATTRDQLASAGEERTTLRNNIRLHELQEEIKEKNEELTGIDIEGAAKAKRHFESQYDKDKQRENELSSQHSRMLGEIDIMKENLLSLERDLDDFKDVQVQYRNQLIKVKMSDMANNDLEKYAKALDQAIMRYHTLKMEEVNDTMKHLWNKTYQGTDIDAIKISADQEGTTTATGRRIYNYRVVMTKDHVEMDMRGRCSAGQKMLASIIIRLALSDSFGQNCGILALDEPTNALDVDNIDALAASLVDIINARKGNLSFQLIVITHDEQFLRKLGEAEVMEYYWRVSRDQKQKSVIERQRFG